MRWHEGVVCEIVDKHPPDLYTCGKLKTNSYNESVFT
jgi:hypothetical protein